MLFLQCNFNKLIKTPHKQVRAENSPNKRSHTLNKGPRFNFLGIENSRARRRGKCKSADNNNCPFCLSHIKIHKSQVENQIM
jgi:hypothetical protein